MAAAPRTLKVFCSAEEQRRLARRYELIERYPSFVLLHAGPADARDLARRHPVEDITDHFQIRIGGRRVDTSAPRVDAEGRTRSHRAYRGVKRLPPGPHHYLVQFVGPIKRSWLTRLRRIGAEPREPFGDYTYVVRCDAAALARVAAERCVRWVGHLSHRDRLQLERDRALPRTRDVARAYRVEFFDSADLERGLRALVRAGARVVSHDRRAGLATVQVDAEGARARRILERLSAVHGVRAIRRFALKRTSNDVGTRIMNSDRALRAPLSLSGRGEIVAVCDTGLDTGDRATLHPDFRGRVVAMRSYPIPESWRDWVRNAGADDGPADLDSGHGTHVAGSAVGSGAASVSEGLVPVRGLAHRARLVFQAVEQEVEWREFADEERHGRFALAGLPDDVTALFRYAWDKGARVHSNSWGGGDPGEYDAQARQLDAFVWGRPEFCVLAAAGNDGVDWNRDGVVDRMSITSPATAKNCISVGASESVRDEFDHETYGRWWPQDYAAAPYRDDPMADDPSQVAAFSSRGPTRDGRIKPDVVAPGTFILSARSRKLSTSVHGWASFPESRRYFYLGGTSMATPLCAGAAALLREFLREWVGYPKPSAALVKACLVAGARRLPGYGSKGAVGDVHQGFGRVDLDAVVAPTGGVEVHFYDDERGLRTGEADRFPLRVTSSTAPLRVALAYTDYPGERLVNNLNLLLRAPDGRIHVGNGEGSGGLVPDTCNNVEVVHLPRPRRGEYELSVVASNVPHGPQRYAFVVSGKLEME